EGGATAGGARVPDARYDATRESVTAQIEGGPEGVSREGLYDLRPAGAARNAVDSALWDLEAKRSGKRVWDLAGRPE
ncbi:dipeptide epimerase, partial [Marimonas sp. MJW-29]